MVNEFPHVCDMDHDEVGYRDDHNPCPVCMEIGRRENLEVLFNTITRDLADARQERDEWKAKYEATLPKPRQPRQWPPVHPDCTICHGKGHYDDPDHPNGWGWCWCPEDCRTTEDD